MRELEATQADNWQRPSKMLHYRSYFSVLVNAEKDCKMKGITRSLVRQAVKNSKGSSFQHAAEQMIVDKLSSPYYAHSRVRGKLVRWGLKGILLIWKEKCLQLSIFETVV